MLYSVSLSSIGYASINLKPILPLFNSPLVSTTISDFRVSGVPRKRSFLEVLAPTILVAWSMRGSYIWLLRTFISGSQAPISFLEEVWDNVLSLLLFVTKL